MGNLHDFLCAVREVLFDLLIGELEDLKPVSKGRLCGAGICKVVDDLAVGESLLNVFVGEVDDHVAVGVGFAFHSIREDDFLLAGLVNPLDFAIVAHYLIDNLLVGC